jgi:hypothetical protein
MQLIRKQLRRIAGATLIAFAGMSFGVPVAQAGMIGTQAALTGAAAEAERAELASLLDREDVQARLLAEGVDPEAVKARVAALSDDEARLLAERLDSLPAGGDIVGALVFVFLVLLVTDLLGLTDIFPFVKKPARR